MQTARELDLMQVEVESYVEKLMEEYIRTFMGERMTNEVTDNLVANGRADGETHLDRGRQPVRPGGEIQYDQRGDISGEPRI